MSLVNTLASDIETKSTWISKTFSNILSSAKSWVLDNAMNYIWDWLQPLAKSWNAFNNLFDRDMYAKDWFRTIPYNIIATISETATGVKNVLNWVPLVLGNFYTKWVQWTVKSITNATTEHIWWIRQIWHLLNASLMIPATIPHTIKWLSTYLHVPFDKMNSLSSTWKSSNKLLEM